MNSLYAFCKHAQASEFGRWHIRRLDDFARDEGTSALCDVQIAYDLGVPVTENHFEHCCERCAKIYREEIGRNDR